MSDNPFIVKSGTHPHVSKNRNALLLSESLRKLTKNDGYIEISPVFDRQLLYYYLDQAKSILQKEPEFKGCKFKVKTIKEGKEFKNYVIFRVS
jgi:hypothetical protein